jgi:hypothetical protein
VVASLPETRQRPSGMIKIYRDYTLERMELFLAEVLEYGEYFSGRR